MKVINAVDKTSRGYQSQKDLSRDRINGGETGKYRARLFDDRETILLLVAVQEYRRKLFNGSLRILNSGELKIGTYRQFDKYILHSNDILGIVFKYLNKHSKCTHCLVYSKQLVCITTENT